MQPDERLRKICVDSINVQFRKITREVENGTELCPTMMLGIEYSDHTATDGGPGSSVGIANELRAGWSGIESQWGRDFPPVQTGPGAHPASCKMGTGSFPGVKCGRGVQLTTHPLLVPRS